MRTGRVDQTEADDLPVRLPGFHEGHRQCLMKLQGMRIRVKGHQTRARPAKQVLGSLGTDRGQPRVPWSTDRLYAWDLLQEPPAQFGGWPKQLGLRGLPCDEGPVAAGVERLHMVIAT